MRCYRDFVINNHTWWHDHANSRGIIGRMIDMLHLALIDDDSRFQISFRLLINGIPGFACFGEWPTVGAAVRAPL